MRLRASLDGWSVTLPTRHAAGIVSDGTGMRIVDGGCEALARLAASLLIVLSCRGARRNGRETDGRTANPLRTRGRSRRDRLGTGTIAHVGERITLPDQGDGPCGRRWDSWLRSNSTIRKTNVNGTWRLTPAVRIAEVKAGSLPFNPFDITVELALRVMPLDEDPSADVEEWRAQLVARPTEGIDEVERGQILDSIDLPPIIVATSRLHRINLARTQYGAFDAVRNIETDFPNYTRLLPDGESLVGDSYYDHLLVVDGIDVDPDFRGCGYGPWLAVEAISLLGSPTTLVACAPDPDEIDPETDPHGYERRRRELIDMASRLGFRPFDDEIMVLRFEEIDFGDAFESIRDIMRDAGVG